MYTITHHINDEEAYRKTYAIGTMEEHLIAHQAFHTLICDVLEDHFNTDGDSGLLQDDIAPDDLIEVHVNEGSPLILTDPQGVSHRLQMTVSSASQD